MPVLSTRRCSSPSKVRKTSTALSENRSGRPSRPSDGANHSISGSNHTSSEPRCLSAALYSGQLVVRYFGDVGLGIRPIYDIRFLMGIYYLVMQQSRSGVPSVWLSAPSPAAPADPLAE